MTIVEKYPHIQFRKQWTITKDIAYMLGQCEKLIHIISSLPIQPKYQKKLYVVSLRKGAIATTAIEGNTLTEQDVEKIEAGHSLPPSKEYQEKEIKNILEAFNLIIKDVIEENQFQFINPSLLKRFNKIIGKGLGQYFDGIPGKFREDNRTVGPYRPPSPEIIELLIQNLCDWLKGNFENDNLVKAPTAILKAIIAHVYIEWIHPFADGNGRTGRLVEFYVLLRQGSPIITSHILSNFYNETRPEYYRQFENARKKNDLTEFLRYAIEGYRDGLEETFKVLKSSLFDISWQKEIYDKFAETKYKNRTVLKRQRTLMIEWPTHNEYTFIEIPVMTNKIAREYALVSERTLQRDLGMLIDMNLIKKQENGKFKANIEQLANYIPAKKQGDRK